jgi:hypothetical protein
MMSPRWGLRGTGRLLTVVVLFGLALIALLAVILLSTQPISG